MEDSLRIADEEAIDKIKNTIDNLLETYQLKEIRSFLRFPMMFYTDIGKAAINPLLIFYKN